MSEEDGIPKSTLKFSPAYTDDRQIYICQVSTSLGFLIVVSYFFCFCIGGAGGV